MRRMLEEERNDRPIGRNGECCISNGAATELPVVPVDAAFLGENSSNSTDCAYANRNHPGLCRAPRTLAVKVLGALEEASQLYDGRAWLGFEQKSWKVGKTLAELPCSNDLDIDAISLLSREEVELEYALKLLGALTSSASELLTAYRSRLQKSTSKLSMGLTSLPDELLSLICKFATHHEQEGTRYAIWLSQVSRKFRRIVVGDRILWDTPFLWYDTTKASVERCISRAGEGSDLHIVVNANKTTSRSPFGLDKFIAACSPFITQWRTLTLSYELVLGDQNGVSSVGKTLDHLIVRKQRVLPRLYELILNERIFERSAQDLLWILDDDPHPFVNHLCLAPNLRVLRCSQFTPPPSFPFDLITHFESSLRVILSRAEEQLGQLLVFLKSRKNLQSVDLELVDFKEEDNMRCVDFGLGIFEYETITSFRLSITGFWLVHKASYFLSLFVNSFQMPSLENFSLFIGLPETNVSRYIPRDTHQEVISDLISYLIPDPLYHERLISFTVHIPLPKVLATNEDSPLSFTIALDDVLHIRTLRITTFCLVLFSYDSEDGLPSRIENSTLRELQLDNCIFMDPGGLRDAVRSLKEINAWDMLESVKIRECDRLNYDKALKVIGKEKLRFADR